MTVCHVHRVRLPSGHRWNWYKAREGYRQPCPLTTCGTQRFGLVSEPQLVEFPCSLTPGKHSPADNLKKKAPVVCRG
jgi:hypothetical protein